MTAVALRQLGPFVLHTGGFSRIEVIQFAAVFLFGGVVTLVASLALSIRAFAWLQGRWYLFL